VLGCLIGSKRDRHVSRTNRHEYRDSGCGRRQGLLWGAVSRITVNVLRRFIDPAPFV